MKTTGRVLLLSTLISEGACEEQIEKFREMFGEEVVVTKRLAKKVAQEFNFSWAAQNLLSASAWKVYEETRAPAWKVYEETRAPAWKVYEETRASAYKVYKETCAPAYKVYKETCALSFATLYISEKE